MHGDMTQTDWKVVKIVVSMRCTFSKTVKKWKKPQTFYNILFVSQDMEWSLNAYLSRVIETVLLFGIDTANQSPLAKLLRLHNS